MTELAKLICVGCDDVGEREFAELEQYFECYLKKEKMCVNPVLLGRATSCVRRFFVFQKENHARIAHFFATKYYLIFFFIQPSV